MWFGYDAPVRIRITFQLTTVGETQEPAFRCACARNQPNDVDSLRGHELPLLKAAGGSRPVAQPGRQAREGEHGQEQQAEQAAERSQFGQRGRGRAAAARDRGAPQSSQPAARQRCAQNLLILGLDSRDQPGIVSWQQLVASHEPGVRTSFQASARCCVRCSSQHCRGRGGRVGGRSLEQSWRGVRSSAHSAPSHAHAECVRIRASPSAIAWQTELHCLTGYIHIQGTLHIHAHADIHTHTHTCF